MLEEFLWIFIHLFKDEKGGGALVHAYVLEHGQLLTTVLLQVDGYSPNLVGIKNSWPPHICIDFWAKYAKGWIQGEAKIGHRGPLFSKNFFFRQEGYSNKLNA